MSSRTKERLQDQVVALVEYEHDTNAIDKLKKLYVLHTDLEGPYYLLFKAIFETKIAIQILPNRSKVQNMADQ